MNSFRTRVSDDFGPRDCGEFVERMHSVRPEETWGVYRGEDLGGMIVVQRLTPVLGFSHMVFSRAFWGRETPLAAARQVADAVFQSGIEKIASMAFADNHQVLAFGRSLGAREEGFRRKHTRRAGVLVDMVETGLLKEDFYGNLNGTGAGLERSGRGRRGPARREQLQDADVHAGADGDAIDRRKPA